MLIVEGSDLVGKTELCKQLVKELDKKGVHTNLQHFGLLHNGWDFYWDYLGYVNSTTVMDRFIMSEVVYGNVVQNGSRISPEIYRLLDAHLTLNGAVTVVVVADDDTMRQQLELKYREREEAFNEKQIFQVNVGFRDLICKVGALSEIHWASRYRCVCDFVHILNAKNGFPSSDELFVTKVVDEYVRRQALLHALVKRRPTHELR